MVVEEGSSRYVVSLAQGRLLQSTGAGDGFSEQVSKTIENKGSVHFSKISYKNVSK